MTLDHQTNYILLSLKIVLENLKSFYWYYMKLLLKQDPHIKSHILTKILVTRKFSKSYSLIQAKKKNDKAFIILFCFIGQSNSFN